MNRVASVWPLFVLGITVACNSADTNDPGFTQTRKALTSLQDRVLGFESPAQDWTSNNGSPLTTSVSAVQGISALSLTPTGYTEVYSRSISGVSGPRSEAQVKVKLPKVLTWGEVRLIVQIPSQGHYWRDLGAISLAGKDTSQWHLLKFNVPNDVKTALGSSAADVVFRLAFNVQSGAGAFLVDSLVVSDEQTGEPPIEVSTQVSISLKYPDTSRPTQVLLSATDHLTIDDQVTLGTASQSPTVSSSGLARSEFGAQTTTYADVVSRGDVTFLRSAATVYGKLTTQGVVQLQNDVRITGGYVQNVQVNHASLDWKVAWSDNGASDFSHPPGAANVNLPPGAYDSIQIFSRSTVTLRSGTYFINSLNVEPAAHLRFDTTGGPVQIYVKSLLRLQVSLEFLQPKHAQVLFGYLGNQVAWFGEAIEAAVISPNAPIELRRPNSGRPHKGAFFGKEVHAFSNVSVLFEPLDLSFLCAATATTMTATENPQAKDGNLACPSVEELNGGYISTKCLTGTEGADFVSLTNGPLNQAPFFFGQGGDDIVVNKLPNAFVVAGSGDDTVCSLSEGDSTAVGGPGADTFITTGAHSMVIPGAGKDSVQVYSGHTDIYINHPCELESGETFLLAGGTATLHAPVTREEIVAMGVQLDNAIGVVVSEAQPCFASCSSAPICASDEECINSDDDAGFCVEKNPSFEQSVPLDERYSELSDQDAKDLRAYVDQLSRGSRTVAPRNIRIRAPFFEKALIKSIDLDHEDDRADEIYALGSLYTETSLAEMERIAAKHAPAGLEIDGHMDFGEGWYLGQLHAVRWLHAAATHLPDAENYIQKLLNVVEQGDQFSAEAAANALLAIGPEPEMRARIASVVPSNSPLLTLNFE